jgi:hypothetical protein
MGMKNLVFELNVSEINMVVGGCSCICSHHYISERILTTGKTEWVTENTSPREVSDIEVCKRLCESKGYDFISCV